MSGVVSLFLSFLLLYKYGAIFVVVLLSAIAVPLPANSVMLAAGAFASQGYLSFSLALSVAVASNMLGDCIGYFLARNYGRAALAMLHVEVPSYVERLEQYVQRHPGPTIFFTRFTGTIDPLTNILSGFIGIPFYVFIFWDFLGNLACYGSIMYIGYFFGVHWPDFAPLVSIAGWVIFLVIAITALSVALWYRRR